MVVVFMGTRRWCELLPLWEEATSVSDARSRLFGQDAISYAGWMDWAPEELDALLRPVLQKGALVALIPEEVALPEGLECLELTSECAIAKEDLGETETLMARPMREVEEMRRKNPMMKDERTHMVAFGFLLYLRYVASEVNCADGPSRGGQVGAVEEMKICGPASAI